MTSLPIWLLSESPWTLSDSYDCPFTFSTNSACCKPVAKCLNVDRMSAGCCHSRKCEDWSQGWVFLHCNFELSLNESISKRGLPVSFNTLTQPSIWDLFVFLEMPFLKSIFNF